MPCSETATGGCICTEFSLEFRNLDLAEIEIYLAKLDLYYRIGIMKILDLIYTKNRSDL
jgi:hypothetical protein